MIFTRGPSYLGAFTACDSREDTISTFVDMVCRLVNLVIAFSKLWGHVTSVGCYEVDSGGLSRRM